MIGYERSCKFECRHKHFKVAMMICAQADGWSEEDYLEKRIRKTCKEDTTSERERESD